MQNTFKKTLAGIVLAATIASTGCSKPKPTEGLEANVGASGTVPVDSMVPVNGIDYVTYATDKDGSIIEKNGKPISRADFMAQNAFFAFYEKPINVDYRCLEMEVLEYGRNNPNRGLSIVASKIPNENQAKLLGFVIFPKAYDPVKSRSSKEVMDDISQNVLKMGKKCEITITYSK